ncbi:MAG TPA: HNH endonuclease [Chloroflexaceae bacterium]|nr:HNH endonuclease [Chloroflexaceae bacterium]
MQAKKREQYYADVEASRARNRARYKANIERRRSKDRERYARPENREKRREKLKAYYARNQEREQFLGRERVRRWRRAHPEQKASQGRRRRARLALTPGAHSEAEWQALKARYGHRCLRCGRREPEVALTRDHVIPLGLSGASDGIENIQPLCGPCNAWKGRRAIDYRASPWRQAGQAG